MKKDKNTNLIVALSPVAGVALILGIILGHLDDQNLDALSGFLIGLSIIENLVAIFVVTRYLRERGGCNDQQKEN